MNYQEERVYVTIAVLRGGDVTTYDVVYLAVP